MIFAIETEEQTLHVFENENAAVGYCEGLDVEATIWLFWNEAGAPLKPEFTVPNKRGLFTVQNGKYHLVKATESHHSKLLEALEHVVAVEGVPPFNTVAAIRQSLTHQSSGTAESVLR
uniref:hypothetical protein n=1 Tax=Methylomonas sp. PHL2-19 TaxID=3438878 RepID=UPI00402BCD04